MHAIQQSIDHLWIHSLAPMAMRGRMIQTMMQEERINSGIVILVIGVIAIYSGIFVCRSGKNAEFKRFDLCHYDILLYDGAARSGRAVVTEKPEG
jgi:hypothetical protein